MASPPSVRILRLSLLVLAALVGCMAEQEDSGVRFVFPFYPRELDILIGHLQSKVRDSEEWDDEGEDENEREMEVTSSKLDAFIGFMRTELYKVKTTLDTCKEINDGNHKAGSYIVNIYDNGNSVTAPSGRVSKLETIAKLREEIESTEKELEKCRFQFWTGDSA